MIGPALPRAWRYQLFDVPRGPWRATKEEALIDALDDGQATEAWWAPHPISISWPGTIADTAEDVAVEGRSPRRRRRKLEEAA